MLAWGGGAVIGVVNGVLRETTYGRRLSEPVAHQVSTVTALSAFVAFFVALQRRWPLLSRPEALGVGGAWLAMTVTFEFGFGRIVDKRSWEELLRDYNVARGRTWPLVLAWLAIGPEAVRLVLDDGRLVPPSGLHRCADR